MNSRETRKKILGHLNSLDQDVQWTNGLTSLFEWLSWNTQHVLGISKTAYWKKAVEWSHESGGTLKQKLSAVERQMKREIEESEEETRSAPVRKKLASPWEALRRTKYFSEEFFNKEFDVFLSLASDAYLDQLFASRGIEFEPGGHWYVHGNGGLFKRSFGVSGMQMDNLCYNPERRLLVANELKLLSGKNEDQILKYAALFHTLLQNKLLVADTKFVLLFIGIDGEAIDKETALAQEAEARSRASKRKDALSAKALIEIARDSNILNTTWRDLIDFNRKYAGSINKQSNQVEWKLLDGFTASLEERLEAIAERSH